MLRLGTLDIVGGDPGPSVAPAPAASAVVALALVPPALVSRALGDLVSGRLAGGAAGFAVEQLCAALIDEAPRAAQSCVDRLVDCGVSVEAIYDTYIPRASARLGEMWNEDLIAFTSVTLGMARLTEVFRRLSPMFLKMRAAAPCGRPAPRKALFALAPGETHALGVVMAADYFQRAGWSVQVELRADVAGLERIARGQNFDVIGFSAGSRRLIPALGAAVSRLRAAVQPSTRFLLGGPLVAIDDAAAERAGLDMAVCDATRALNVLEKGV